MSPENNQKLNNLLVALADGHAEYLDGIYDIAGGKMLAAAISIVRRRHTAEDIVHDSLIKIAKSAAKYRDGTDPSAWIMSIVRRTALDYLRAEKRHVEVNIDFCNLSSLGYSEEKRESALALEQAVNSLNDEDRLIIYYAYYLDLPLREIARRLKKSKSAVQRAVKRAENNLKNLLAGGTNDDP